MRKALSDNRGLLTRMSRFAIPAFTVVLLLIVAGCTTGQPAPAPATTTVPPSTIQTPVTTVTVATTATESPEVIADRAFAAAADACYRQTPVLTNLSDQLVFATCMQNTPLPLGNCAKNWRYYVLKDTNTDPTTAGLAQETEDNRLAREAYLKGWGYDGTRLEYVPCGNGTLIPTSILT